MKNVFLTETKVLIRIPLQEPILTVCYILKLNISLHFFHEKDTT